MLTCWVTGHTWFWCGVDTGGRDVIRCSGCGVTKPAPVTVVYSTFSQQ